MVNYPFFLEVIEKFLQKENELSKLEILNLSHNMFSGSIPSSFKELISLSSIDVSYNDLECPLPDNRAFLNASPKAFINNKGRISSKEEIIIFSNAAFKAKEGYASIGFVMMLNDVIVDAGAIQGPKVVSSKEVEARAVLATLEKAWKNGFDRLRILTDTQEVVYALKGGLGPLTQLF